MSNDEILALAATIGKEPSDAEMIAFARAIESRALTKQKAKWYYEGLEAGLRKTLAKSPKREWVELTDEEIAQAVGSPLDEVYLADFRKVEDKLKVKNCG